MPPGISWKVKRYLNGLILRNKCQVNFNVPELYLGIRGKREFKDQGFIHEYTEPKDGERQREDR
jgi:hypothetical protein